MGYRSQVSIAIVKVIFDEKGYALKKDMVDCDSILLVSGDRPYYIFVWDSVKWYESYPEVSSVMEFLSELDEDDYGFLRIGEDDTDIENKGCPHDFELTISISMNIPEGEDLIKYFFKENSVKFITEPEKKET
jgi:hypothetical protein